MPIFNKDGWQMHYEVHRRAAPQTTLLVHGNVASSRWWTPLIECFHQSPGGEGDVIVADWRGSGRSSAPREVNELAPRNLARDFLDLLDHLAVNRCQLVGHSAGGLIGLHCLLLDGRRFDRALLLDPVAATGLVVTAEKKKIFEQMKSQRNLVEKALAGAMLGVSLEDPFFQALVDDACRTAELNWLGVLEQFSNFDIRQRLSDIANEVLVLFGDRDSVLPIDGGREIAELLPNGRFREIGGAGHSLNLENPLRFFNEMSEFLYQ